MSDDANTKDEGQPGPDATNEATPAEDATAGKTKADPVRRWTLILLVLAAALLTWHLRADRFTPITSQARLNALVVPVAAEVSGKVVEVGVSNNQRVEGGDVLFRIDPSRYALSVQAAEASLEAAQQAVGAARANVDAARAGLASAQAGEERSRKDYERLRRIREEDPGAISERRLESAEASLKVSVGQVEAARASLARALEDLGAEGDENSRILQARASLENARLDLERTTVQAPDAGVVTDVRLDTGAFVSAGQPQMTFIATHRVWVQADYTENNLGHLDAGDEVELTFDALPGRVVSGRVREVGFGVQVDSTPPGQLPKIDNDRAWLRAAQRYPVLIDITEALEPEDRRVLKVGSQVSVITYATEHHVLLRALGRAYIRLAALLSYAY